MQSGPLAEFIARRTELIESAAPGTAATRDLSDLTDEPVSALAEAGFAASGVRWGLLALGAYGSGRLLPFSDLDLVVIVTSNPHAAKDAVQSLLYPLWDAGFEVGHAVRTRKEHLKACAENIETLTATLTGRHLAGDPALTAGVLEATAAFAHRRRSALLRALDERPRPGSPYDLEPDLKAGAGGQRDIDELTWRSAIELGTPAWQPDAASALGILGDAELEELDVAQDRISAARWTLHRSAGRKEAVLDLDSASTLPSGNTLHESLAVAHELLLATRGHLSAEDLQARPWGSGRLLDTLSAGSPALPRLECAARRGALAQLAPGLDALMTLRRPALSHRLTVGAHSLATTVIALELPATDRIAVSALEPGTMPLELVAAGLMHDAGKWLAGPGHAERGEAVAVTTALALGAGTDAAHATGVLVREHLLLAETASGCDIDDEDVILRVASRIKDRGLLALLYVLTAADSMATGPGTWDSWHASLVRTLVSRLDRALADDVDGAGMVKAAESVRSAALAIVDDDATAAVLQSAPVRFMTGRTATEATEDARLVTRLGPRGSRVQSLLRISTSAAPRAYRVAIVTYDRPGAFALVAGAIALSGLDILGATAFTGLAGTVLNTFTVVPATHAEIGIETWTTLERRLSAALDGHLDVRVRLAERRRHYPSRSSGPSAVSARTESSFSTTVMVEAPDRPGLLFDLADEISRAGLSIIRMVARTLDGCAHDTIHVIDADGVAPSDPGELGHLAMRIRDRLAHL